jgi:serine/threonine protein kinase
LKGDATLKRVCEVVGPGYECISKIGSGSFSKVYLLKHRTKGEKKALKIMDSDNIRKRLEKEYGSKLVSEKFEKIKSRFKKEAELQNEFAHPNIVKICKADFVTVKGIGIPYILMEYIEGLSLRDLLKDKKSLGFARVMEISENVLNALSHVHEKNVIHRDLYTANIMIADKGRGKSVLIDFGISKKIIDDSKLTTTGTAIGTPLYMAPEHFRSGAELKIATDIYSFGVILFEMLTGEVPFTGSLVEIMDGHIKYPVPDITNKNPELPVKIQEIIEKAMAKKIEDRYKKAEDMLTDLQKIEYDGKLSNNNPGNNNKQELSADEAKTVKIAITDTLKEDI